MNHELDEMAPDHPRWVEARGMALSSRCEILGPGEGGHGYVLISTDGPLICIVGRPRASIIRDATLRLRRKSEIIAPPDAADLVAEAVPEWTSTRYAVQLLSSSPGPGPKLPDEVKLCESADDLPLDHVSDELRSGFQNALKWSPIAAAFTDGRPVAFCHASWQTETHWDVSIDTLETHRRRGLATECVRALVRWMHGRGKRPVWGALHTNSGAMIVAKKLGFRPVDEMIQFCPRER